MTTKVEESPRIVTLRKKLTKVARTEISAKLGLEKAKEWRYNDVADDYTPEEKERAEALQKQWKALQTQGLEEKWLEWSGGYLDAEVEEAYLNKHPTRTIKVKEFAATRTERINKLTEQVEIEVTKRVDREIKQIVKAEAVLAKAK